MIKVMLKNFNIKEFECKCGCGTFNMKQDFLIRLQAFRSLLGKPLTITSGCRCKAHNESVGGQPNSLHECSIKKASAADVTNHDVKEIYTRACLSGLFNEVIWYKKLNFVHLGCDPNQKANYFHIK